VRRDVAVIGAFVVRAPGSAIDEAAISNFFKTRLAPYKHPREIVFLDALPRTANGKIRRNALAALREARSVTKT
jgi:acetyl-CoA synthetase